MQRLRIVLLFGIICTQFFMHETFRGTQCLDGFFPDIMKSMFATTFPDSFPIFSRGDDPTSQAEFKGLPALY